MATPEEKLTSIVPAERPEITTELMPTGGLMPKTFDSLYRMATIMAASGLMPKDIEKPEAVFVAVQMGLEVGLSPMQAVQNIAVVNGRPAIWGDSVLGLVRASGLMDEFREEFVGTEFNDDFKAVCTAVRKGQSPIVREFSVADAKRADLWCADKQNLEWKKKLTPWFKYPKRMLQMRARSWALRDGFGDVLKGLRMAEEVQDYEVDMVQTTNGYKPAPPEETTEDLESRILKGDNGDAMTDEDVDMGKTVDSKPEKPLDWNPLTAPLQQQYRKPKQDAIMIELEDRGIEFNAGWSGRRLHQLLLDDIPSIVEPDDEMEEYTKKLDEANTIFKRRQETSPEIWASAVKNAGVDELGLADLDEADRFDACFLEVIEGG